MVYQAENDKVLIKVVEVIPHAPTEPTLNSPASLDNPLYYLHNFRWVLDWVCNRYGELLSDAERQFVTRFHAAPEASQGLLVRMVMRKGQVFRADKLTYAELGCTHQAAAPLVAQGWVNAAPLVDLETLFKLFTWPDLRQMLAARLTQAGLLNARKGDALAALAELGLAPATLTDWGATEVQLYELTVMPLCDRFRLMFFGNAHQDWSEFVLTELGTYEYEPVEFDEQSRPFHSRAEVDAYLHLHACRERFYSEEPLHAIAADLPTLPTNNPWLARGRDRLLFQLAREWERAGELAHAYEHYQQCGHPEARGRLLRVLECQGEYQQAWVLAQQVEADPQNEAERQQLKRLLPRLQRKLGLPRVAPSAAKAHIEEFTLTLPPLVPVELAVKQHLDAADAPVYYVENTLLTGLFGLLCWDAVFAPLPGAFFHPFQRGPADLHWPDFYRRRAPMFEACLQLLDRDDHRERILKNFRGKQCRQSPFVHWGVLSETLLEHALLCIPAIHLKRIFQRLLSDIKANRSGLPDLIQFWPEQRQYRMIEVKAPGDRLQDNQRRWLDFFAAHQMPAAVCYVRWQSQAEDD